MVEFPDAYLVKIVYALFDKRYRTQTSSRKVSRLRKWHLFNRFSILVRIRKKLEHPNLEKALDFLDDRLLEKTSNAVERSNRRHRKMQKTIYRVRTVQTIKGRIKLDMMRDVSFIGRSRLADILHKCRWLNRRATIEEHAIVEPQRWCGKAG